MSATPDTRVTELVLQAQDLRRTYGEHVAVERFSATVAAGEVVVLVGPNGCGKTTSIEMAIGLRRSESGFSRIAGRDVNRERREVAQVVGVQLQGAAMHARVRVREQLEALCALRRTPEQLEELPRALGLETFLDKLFGSLSGGMQRRALVAFAFVGRPRFVVLDEPTSGVDIESRNDIWNALRQLLLERGAGVLVTTHDLTEAGRYGDRVLVMRNGVVIAQGPPAELIAASGIASVVTVRVPSAASGALRPPQGARVLQASPIDWMLAFESVGASRAFCERTAEASPNTAVTERRPTLEDAYLALATGPPEAAL